MWYLYIHLVYAKLFALLAIKINHLYVISWLEQPYYNGKMIFWPGFEKPGIYGKILVCYYVIDYKKIIL